MKTTSAWYIIIVLAIAGLIWYISAQIPAETSATISNNGLHWHTQLAIYVKGEQQQIPADIGLGAVHQPVHTHDPDGSIHMEFAGVVKERDLKLGQFFNNWGKDIRLLGSNLRMTVNGADNTEYENYVMHDLDQINLYYDDMKTQ